MKKYNKSEQQRKKEYQAYVRKMERVGKTRSVQVKSQAGYEKAKGLYDNLRKSNDRRGVTTESFDNYIKRSSITVSRDEAHNVYNAFKNAVRAENDRVLNNGGKRSAVIAKAIEAGIMREASTGRVYLTAKYKDVLKNDDSYVGEFRGDLINSYEYDQAALEEYLNRGGTMFDAEAIALIKSIKAKQQMFKEIYVSP